MAEELTQDEINERIAVLKRFKKLLEMQRSKFKEYLHLLEQQEQGIADDNDESAAAHAELENQIVSNIKNLQKVITPIENMYRQIDAPISAEIPALKNELKNLQDEVLVQNEKNRELLKLHMEELHNRIDKINNPKNNPYANRRNVYVQVRNTASLVDVEG